MWNKEVMGFDIFYIFYDFFIYCFLGWIYESCFVSIKEKSWVNRGFLTGPVIPIYGAGATAIYLILYPLEGNLPAIFFCGILTATVLEYVTSYVMEKLFHAKWWDYSEYRFNFQGRICLYASLFWGVLSSCMFKFIQPGVDKIIAWIPRQAGEYAGYAIAVLFLTDLSITVIYTFKLDKLLSDMAKMRTEFAEYIASKNLLGELEGRLSIEEMKKSLRTGRISEAYDKIKERMENGKDLLEHAKFDDLKEEMETKYRALLEKYQYRFDMKASVQRRLLKAFPTMKSMNRDHIIKDLRESWKIKQHKER